MTPARGALVLATALLLARGGAAFELERVDRNPCGVARNLSWSDRTAPVTVAHLPASLQPLGRDAMARWNSALPTFSFRESAGARCNVGDGVVSLVVSPQACDGSDLGGDVLALTILHWGGSGELLGGDTAFNSRHAELLGNAAAFREVTMHELGHVLGLDHSDACGESGAGTLMASLLYYDQPRYTAPQADDIAGAKFIYGSGSPPPPSLGTPATSTCAVVAPEAGGTSRRALVVLGALALLLRRKPGRCLKKVDGGRSLV